MTREYYKSHEYKKERRQVKADLKKAKRDKRMMRAVFNYLMGFANV